MKKGLRTLPLADADLDATFHYLQEHRDLETAWHFYDGVQESLEQIRQMPLIGSPRRFRSSRIGFATCVNGRSKALKIF